MSQYYEGKVTFTASSREKAVEVSKNPELKIYMSRVNNHFSFSVIKGTNQEVDLIIKELKKELFKIDPTGEYKEIPYPGV